MADEWEESIVYVELCGVASANLFPSEGGSQNAEILGLASERPLMQVNGHTFAGHYEDTVGTHLIMAANKANPPSGSAGRASVAPSVDWELLCKTDKKLVMHPSFLVDQTSASSDKPGDCSSVSAAGPSVETSISSLREEQSNELVEEPAEEPADEPADKPAEESADD